MANKQLEAYESWGHLWKSVWNKNWTPKRFSISNSSWYAWKNLFNIINSFGGSLSFCEQFLMISKQHKAFTIAFWKWVLTSRWRTLKAKVQERHLPAPGECFQRPLWMPQAVVLSLLCSPIGTYLGRGSANKFGTIRNQKQLIKIEQTSRICYKNTFSRLQQLIVIKPSASLLLWLGAIIEWNNDY